MKIAITGTTGFVGRNLLRQVLEEDRYERVILPVRNRGKLVQQIKAEGFEPDDGRLRIIDWGCFEEIGEVEHVVHAAGVLFARTRDEYDRVNVGDTGRLIRAISPGARVLVLSSQSAGGPTPSGKDARSVEDPDEPLTWYGMSKLDMEHRVLEARPDALVWRPPMILGPRDAATLPLFRMASGALQIKPGTEPKSFSWIFVGDLVSAILDGLDSPRFESASPRVAYVAAPTTITDEELISEATRLRGNRPRLIRLSDPMLKVVSAVVDVVPPLREGVPSLTRDRVKEIYPQRWVVDADRFVEEYKPSTTFQQAMLATHEWYCDAKDGKGQRLLPLPTKGPS